MKRTNLVSGIALALIAAAAAPALAGDVDITKNRDSNIKVWKTLLGYRFGDPVYSGTLPAGHKLKIGEGWLTDLSVEQDPVAVGLRHTTTGMAMVTGSPGSYTMPQLEDAVYGLAGTSRIAVPDMASSFFDIFVTIDLDDYVMGGGSVPPVGSMTFATSGQIAGMPGVFVSTAPFDFDSTNGWYTTAPYTGSLEIIGEMGLQTPAPGSTALLTVGAALIIRRRR